MLLNLVLVALLGLASCQITPQPPSEKAVELKNTAAALETFTNLWGKDIRTPEIPDLFNEITGFLK